MRWLDTWRAFIGAAPPVRVTSSNNFRPISEDDVIRESNKSYDMGRQHGQEERDLAAKERWRWQSASALPHNLKRLREAKGLSPTQLASKAKVSASTVRGMEAPGDYDQGGTRSDPNPTLTSLLAVAGALGVGIEAFVEERKP